MKHQNVIDKTRSYTQAKAQKSKALYAKNHHEIAAAAPLPAAPVDSASPSAETAEPSFIQKVGTRMKENPGKLAVAGGVVATVAVATTLAIGEKVGKTKLGQKAVAAEKKALNRAKELVAAVKSSAVAKSVTKSVSKSMAKAEAKIAGKPAGKTTGRSTAKKSATKKKASPRAAARSPKSRTSHATRT